MERCSTHLGLDGQLTPQACEKLGGSQPIKYKRGKRASGTSAETQAIIDAIFESDPTRTRLMITWVDRLRYQGAEYEAGFTWISAIMDGSHFYAFIPKQGILELEDRQVWLFLELYPTQGCDHYGLPVLRISKDAKPSGRFTKLQSKKLTIMTTMSVARREVLRDGTVKLRFTPLL